MTKFLVETKDNLQVVGNGEEMHARYNRPSVVRKTGFIEQHVALGTITILAQLTDEASDKEFAEQYEAAKDEDAKEAVTEDYGKMYAPEGKKKPAPAAPPAPPAPKA